MHSAGLSSQNDLITWTVLPLPQQRRSKGLAGITSDTWIQEGQDGWGVLTRFQREGDAQWELSPTTPDSHVVCTIR